jgi:hypothetical protein
LALTALSTLLAALTGLIGLALLTGLLLAAALLAALVLLIIAFIRHVVVPWFSDFYIEQHSPRVGRSSRRRGNYRLSPVAPKKLAAKFQTAD